MHVPTNRPAEAPARVLALMVAANGRIDERELRMLDELDAYRRIGVSRDRFIELARGCLHDVGSHLSERPWLHLADWAYVERLLHDVGDRGQRLTVCRLAAAVITADGRITREERMVYDHTLARWRISQTMVAHAIMSERLH